MDAEAERAAKAARAKALLNKRRAAHKVPTAAASSPSQPTSAHPSPPASSYAPSNAPASPTISTSQLPEDEQPSPKVETPSTAASQRRGSTNTNGSHDPYASLLNRTKSPLASPPSAGIPPSTARVASPPSLARVASPPSNILHSPTMSPTITHSHSLSNEETQHLQRLVTNQQQTITLLVSEKASLTAALERLEGLDEKYGMVEGQLEASKRAAQTLESRSRDLEEQLGQLQNFNSSLSVKERSLSETLKQKERDLDLLRKDAFDSQTRATTLEMRLKDLQEQIQADDRVERLEASLKGLQDRSQSLESQLAKVKQQLTQAKSEKDSAQSELVAVKEREKSLGGERDSLASKLAEVQASFDSLQAEHTILQSTHSEISTASSTHAKSLEDAKRKLAIEAGKGKLLEQKIKSLMQDVMSANKRAEEADHQLKNLQNENSGLLAGLNEMRPRLVQLSDEKAELMMQAERLEKEREEVEGVVAKLENDLEEEKGKVQEKEEQIAGLEKGLSVAREGADSDFERLQQALGQTEEDLATSHRSIKDLEQERTVMRQAVERYQMEMDRLDTELADLRARHSSLQDEFAMQRSAREQDAQDILASHEVVERANTEVEALRNDLYQRDEEIESLRNEIQNLQVNGGGGEGEKTARPGHNRSGSLGKEMFESDGTFELSQARSKIRSLESTVFTEQAKAHGLRKQIASLEEELHRVRRTSTPHNGRPTLSNHSSQNPAFERDLRALERGDDVMETALDSALPPDVRHKRKISLSMLKARIDGEAALGKSPRPSLKQLGSSNLDATLERDEEMDEKAPLVDKGKGPEKRSVQRVPSVAGSSRGVLLERRRPQFLDESHVFWCGSCRGDLVVL